MGNPKGKMRKLVPTVHDWMTVATTGDDHPYDVWEWCKNCGVLMVNGEEFFIQGAPGLQKEHPEGQSEEPTCPPPKPS